MLDTCAAGLPAGLEGTFGLRRAARLKYQYVPPTGAAEWRADSTCF